MVRLNDKPDLTNYKNTTKKLTLTEKYTQEQIDTIINER